jgi:hypothetical protein
VRPIDAVLVSSLLLASCTSKGGDSISDESDADTDADSDTDTDTDTGPDTWTVNGLTAWLHPEVESMVYLQWDQSAPAEAHVEYSFDTDDEGEPIWRSSPTRPATAGTNERILVGIPFDVDVELRLVLEGKKTVDGPLVHTGRIAIVDETYPLPLPTLVTYDAKQAYAGGNYLLTSINSHSGGWRGGTYWTIVVDRQGRIVWARPTPDQHWTLYVTIDPVTRNHFLWDESTYWSDYDSGNASRVHRAYLDQEISTIATRGLHHEWISLPDGTLVWGSQSPSHSTTEALVELPPGAKDPNVIWTCADDWLNSGTHCESNGLFYDTARNSYIYSFYTNSSVVEVDRATGASVWWAGTVAGGYEFDPPSSQFDWQHGVSITSDGNLLLSTKSHANGTYGTLSTMVREYEIDHSADTLRDVWHCDSGVYASTNGDAWRLPNGNTLHVVGSIGQIEEYLPDCTVVWHVDFESNYLLGRGEFVEDLYTLLAPH